MKLGTFKKLAITLIAVAFPTPLRADEARIGAAPQLVIVAGISESAEQLTCEWREVQRGPVGRYRVRFKDGTEKEFPRMGNVHSHRGKNFWLDNLDFYDSRGNKLTRKDFLSRIKPGDVVLLSGDDHVPEQQYLRLFKEDVLVLVHIERVNKGPTSVPTQVESEELNP